MRTHFFRRLTIGTCFCIFVTLAFASADQLKPRQWQQEQEFKQFLDRLNREGLEYQIKVEYREFNEVFFGRHHFEGYVHRITLPKQIDQRVVGYDWLFVQGIFPKYLDDPKYSFNTGLFLAFRIQEGNRPGGRWGVGYVCAFRIEPFEKHDKSLWEHDLQRYTAIFRGGTLLDPKRYREKLLYESIPESFLKDIFSDRVHRFGASIVEKPVNIKDKPYEEGVREFNASTNTSKLLELDLTQENLEVWLYLTIASPETIRLDITKDFCAWCRQNEPKDNPFLSALMMGLFIVDGYVFDDEKGAYHLNDRGKLLLDYIVEFPIPENATRLKIIRDGGNESLVEDLMKKRSTTETWQELLKNPVEPKFVKYKLSRPGIP